MPDLVISHASDRHVQVHGGEQDAPFRQFGRVVLYADIQYSCMVQSFPELSHGLSFVVSLILAIIQNAN
jgi:hypothetical protein